MATKLFVFEPNDLLRLLTHYTDGGVPLDGEATNVMVNERLQRFVGIEVRSKEWEDFTPLHIRYEGARVMSWSKGTGDEPIWNQTPDTPTRQ